MSKKRWDKPNELLWSTVLCVGLFMMCAESVPVILLALALMLISGFKLKDVDLEEECNEGFHFTDD